MIEVQDLIDSFGERELIALSDRHKTGAIDLGVANKAILEAEAEVASYLIPAKLVLADYETHSYRFFTGQTPDALKAKVCDIARYRLYEDGVTTIVEDRYKQALEWLRLVMKNPTMLCADLNAEQKSSGISVKANSAPSQWEDYLFAGA